MGGQRRGPAAAATPPATGLALGQKNANAALRRAAPQQFGIGGVHRPGHLQVVQQGLGIGRQVAADRLRVKQLQCPGQAVALARTALDIHTSGPKSLNPLPNGGPGLAQLTGQGIAGQATGSEFGQQLAIVHGSFRQVRQELCGKGRAGARRGASTAGPGSGYDRELTSP